MTHYYSLISIVTEICSLGRCNYSTSAHFIKTGHTIRILGHLEHPSVRLLLMLCEPSIQSSYFYFLLRIYYEK